MLEDAGAVGYDLAVIARHVLVLLVRAADHHPVFGDGRQATKPLLAVGVRCDEATGAECANDQLPIKFEQQKQANGASDFNVGAGSLTQHSGTGPGRRRSGSL